MKKITSLSFLLLTIIFYFSAQAQSWIELSPTDGPPLGRGSFTAVYNPESNRMIIFGGETGVGNCGFSCVLNDVWVLQNANGLDVESSAWIQLSPTNGSPIKRFSHSAIYDPASNRMTIFGGQDRIGYCEGTLGDVWVLEFADGIGGTPNWIQLSPTGTLPSNRKTHSAVYDPGSNRMILFGGMSTGCIPPVQLTEVWILDDANGIGSPNWIQLSPTGGPPPPSEHTADYDADNNRMIVLQQCCDESFPDLWILEDANGLDVDGNSVNPHWIQPSHSGAPTDMRIASSVYDPVSNQMIVFGGVDNTGLLNVTWVIENANGLDATDNPANLQWAQISPDPDPVNGLITGRDGHSAIYDQDNKRMTIFGGRIGYQNNNGIMANDTWVLEVNATPVTESPQIISVNPLQNALNISANANISVTFDQDINSATINANTFIIHAFQTGLHTGTYNYDNGTKTATFDPTGDFQVGEVVTVILTTDIQDTGGTALSNPYEWSFTVEVDGGSGKFAAKIDYTAGNGPHSVFSSD
ncbi:MAG: Ig-like domain-containing protein, partial [Candidatus Marinimicrobia bacterium]|nr:Ig-like domain-containing protein [Candidatus Neomarinimicrobiota bacterium]